VSWRDRAAWDREYGGEISQVIQACIEEVKKMEPAATSQMTFEGGKRRAISVLKKFQKEVKPR
jgi:hypothetical protein